MPLPGRDGSHRSSSSHASVLALDACPFEPRCGSGLDDAGLHRGARDGVSRATRRGHQRGAARCRRRQAGPTVLFLKLMGAVSRSFGVGVLAAQPDIISFGSRQQAIPLAPGDRYTGLVLLFSVETGEPLAIFPDGILQRMRVGATSAIAAKFLARDDALRRRDRRGLAGGRTRDGHYRYAQARVDPLLQSDAGEARSVLS